MHAGHGIFLIFRGWKHHQDQAHVRGQCLVNNIAKSSLSEGAEPGSLSHV